MGWTARGQQPEQYDYTIRNKTFEDTVGIKREAFEDDSYGVYAPTMEELGRQAAKLPDDLIADLILNGQSKLCFDGQYFFDTDHPMGGSTQSNLFTGKPFSETTFAEVRQAMQLFKDDSGRPMGVNPNLLVVGPKLEIDARKVINATLTANGGTNVLAGIVDLLVLPDLGATEDWELFDTTRPIKPFVHQTRRAPRFVSRTDVTDDNVFSRNKFEWGVDLRANAGYGLWFLAAKATKT